MTTRERLISALQSEIDNADFSTEEKQDDSYQSFIANAEEIYKMGTDNSLSLQDIAEVINIINDLELTLTEAYLNAIAYLEQSTPVKIEHRKKKVFVVQFDWSTTDSENVDLFIYGSYDKAYEKFHEIIFNERNPEMSWVGNIEFDDEGYPVDERYECDYEDNNSCESEVWWHIVDKNDWNIHSFVDLLVMEVM